MTAAKRTQRDHAASTLRADQWTRAAFAGILVIGALSIGCWYVFEPMRGRAHELVVRP